MRLSRYASSLLSIAPAVSQAHSFGTPYTLPIPLWMYAYGCAAILVVTFAVVGFFATTPAAYAGVRTKEVIAGAQTRNAFQWGLLLLRAGAAGCLLLTIIAGLIGNQDPGANIGMALFWVIFLLGLTYLTLFLGDLYALINPWKSAIEGLERMGLDLTRARVGYPPRWGYWPAFWLYFGLIWFELFVGPRPFALSVALILYSLTTFAGVALFGRGAWFARVDAFSVFFRLIGKLAPIEYGRDPDEHFWRVQLRPPFVGALAGRPDSVSLVLFVLLMLSATTYDAVHDTLFWTGLYWKNLLWLLKPLWGEDLGKAQLSLMGGYLAYRQAGLFLFPLLYFGVYTSVLLWTQVLTSTPHSLRTLALDFCYSLIPIALAYHFAHYCTFLIAQTHSIPRLFADPFGFGWSWLHVARVSTRSPLPIGVIWHTQVSVLLLGHLVSIYLAHRIALRTFSGRQVLTSQVPLLALMVAYTTVGLWVLSLPLE